MRNLVQIISLLLVCASTATGCDDGRGSGRTDELSEKIMGQQQRKIPTLYDKINIENMPEIVQLNDEERAYIIDIFSAANRVISGVAELESEEKRLLGNGEFFWPKDPTKPIKTTKSYRASNFRMSGISLGFERKSQKTPWIKAGFSVQPKNFPRGAYAMHLPRSVFDEFSLVKATRENWSGERVNNPVVFFFIHKRIREITLTIESREDLVSVKDPYPSSFHAVQISRQSAM